MFSKKAVVISTAAGTGVKSAIKDIKNALFYWGIPYIKVDSRICLYFIGKFIADYQGIRNNGSINELGASFRQEKAPYNR